MGLVTFQAIDGLERGQTFRDLSTPVNIGREEDNQIRLNDDRISRFHAKVQEQQEVIERQQAEIERLKERLARLEAALGVGLH